MRNTMRRKKIFTLLEVMVVTIIVLILAGLGVLSYRQVIENARQRVCTLNLKVLEEALKSYCLEEDVFPASFGELKLKHLEKAYAKVMREGNYLLNKLAFFIVKINNPSLAYGKDDDKGKGEKKSKGKGGGKTVFLPFEAKDSGKKFFFPDTLKKYGVTEEIFHCPSDPSGEVSYAINQNLAGKKWEDIAPGTPLVVCTSCPIKGKNGGNLFDPSGKGICGRHFKNLGATKNISQAVLKGGIIVKGNKRKLVSIFYNIVNKCIVPQWRYCTKICSGKLYPGGCISNCREQNNKRIPSLMRCIDSYIPH